MTFKKISSVLKYLILLFIIILTLFKFDLELIFASIKKIIICSDLNHL